MKTSTRHTIQFILAFVIVFVGLVLLFISFVVKPTGVIDTSVLAAFGEILTFSGALIGIDYSYKVKMVKYTRNANDSEDEEEDNK